VKLQYRRIVACEALEDPFVLFGGYSWAVVGDRDADLVRIAPQGHADFAAVRGVANGVV
jgi:hypothetical protein